MGNENEKIDCGSDGDAAAGCGSAGAVPTATPNQSPIPTSAYEDETEALEKQREWIEDNYELWEFQDLYDTPWFYSITDLDHNGRAEVTTAYVHGAGLFTTAFYWEINGDGTALVPCESHGDEDMPWMDIIRDETPCYHDKATGRYYYVYEKMMGGTEVQERALFALCLYHGWLEVTPLCFAAEVYSDSGAPAVLNCHAADGTEISEEEYRNYADRFFVGMEKTILNVRWTRGGEMPSGEAALEAAAADGQPVITKNPESETLSIGGRTWFTAHAVNANQISWQMIAPNGKVYSLMDAMAANPGLLLKVMEGDILDVSSVPYSLDGWAVQANFEGQDGSTETGLAYIHVGDYLTAYSSVIEKYRSVRGERIKENESQRYDVSELAVSAADVGYAIKDLDGDGVPELIIAGFGTDDQGLKPIADLYTLRDGQPRRLKMGMWRSRPYLTTDHKIYGAGTNGVDKSIKNIYRFEDGELFFEEGFLSLWEEEEKAIGWYHTIDMDYDFANDTRISTEEAKEQIAEYESSTYLPPLTKIE